MLPGEETRQGSEEMALVCFSRETSEFVWNCQSRPQCLSIRRPQSCTELIESTSYSELLTKDNGFVSSGVLKSIPQKQVVLCGAFN